jgi:hypothetical protein
MANTWVYLNNKRYCVVKREGGAVNIYVQWEAFNIAERNFALRSEYTRSRYVDPAGRLGKKVLALVAALDEGGK